MTTFTPAELSVLKQFYARVPARRIRADTGIIQEVYGFSSVYQAVAGLELNGFKPTRLWPGRGKYHDLDAPKPITWKSLWLPDAHEQPLVVH